MELPLEPVPTMAGQVPTCVAKPSTPGPWPGVVIVHDALGMTADLHHQAAWLAAGGYLAAAPDLFHGGGHLRCLVRTMYELARGQSGQATRVIDGVRDWLQRQPDCSGAVGILGFCLGGGFALSLASGHGYRAAAPNYGDMPAKDWTALDRPCPIVASYGQRDPTLKGGATRLREVLERLGVPHDVHEYPGAGHGFMNHHDPRDSSPLFNLLMRASRTAFDAQATADARSRILAFFDRHLRTEPDTTTQATEPR